MVIFKIMKSTKLNILCILFSIFQISCDNADELLEKYVENGPIVYAGKINDLDLLSGYYKLGVNIFPSEDVNKSYCLLKWNNADGKKDSLRVDYSESNYDSNMGGYFKILNLPAIEGNILIEALNIDIFGNKSLLFTKGGYVYGDNYVNTLLPSSVKFTLSNSTIEFDNKMGVVDNIVSYEQTNGQFTPEVKVVKNLLMVEPKKGGIVRSKTRYLINSTDIDTLSTVNYIETIIP